MRYRALPWLMLAWAVFLSGSVDIADRIGLRINHTASLPIGLWRVSPVHLPLSRGIVVSFCPPRKISVLEARTRGYLGTGRCPGGIEPMLKQVQAIAGDKVELSATGVSVNGALLPNSRRLCTDARGRPLSSTAFDVVVLPSGTFWAGSADNARSFDSRYFGPVGIDNILGVAVLLARWPTS